MGLVLRNPDPGAKDHKSFDIVRNVFAGREVWSVGWWGRMPDAYMIITN